MEPRPSAPPACPIDDGVEAPIQAFILLAPIGIAVILGTARTYFGAAKWASALLCACAPRVAAWLDSTIAESAVMAMFMGFFLIPIIAAALQAKVLTTSHIMGIFIQILMALLIIPATRTSLLIRVFGMPYDRTLRFHRWCAWLVVVTMWTHTLMYLLKSGACVLNNNIGAAPPMYGMVSVILFTVIALTSFAFVRRRFFELFRVTHWLFVPAYALAIAHTYATAYYAAIPASIYIYDRIRRYLRSHQKWVVTELHPYGCVTHITLTRTPPSFQLPFTYAAGQFCFINIPSISYFQWHPFSLVSHPAAPTTDAAGHPTVSFAIKAASPGTWSHQLLLLAQKGSPAPIIAHVDGPFGGLSRRMEKYKAIVIVGGGIGATPCVPILQQLCAGLGACERVTFVWAVREFVDFAWALDALRAVTVEGQTGKVVATVSLYVTKADTGDTDIFPIEGAGPRFTMHRGRPDLSAIIAQAVAGGVSVRVDTRGDADIADPDAAVTVKMGAPVRKADTLVIASGPETVIEAAQQAAVCAGVHFSHEAFNF